MEELEEQVELCAENARQLGLAVSQVQASAPNVANTKINNLVDSLSELEKLRNAVEKVQIPKDVLSYVDDGKNPHLFTRDVMERTLQANEVVRGKIQTLKRLKEALLREMERTFPNESRKYRAIWTGFAAGGNSGGAATGGPTAPAQSPSAPSQSSGFQANSALQVPRPSSSATYRHTPHQSDAM